MKDTHQHLIASLEAALPALRDVEQIAEYLIKIKAHYPTAYNVNDRIQDLHQKLSELYYEEKAPQFPHIATAQS